MVSGGCLTDVTLLIDQAVFALLSSKGYHRHRQGEWGPWELCKVQAAKYSLAVHLPAISLIRFLSWRDNC